MPKLSDILREIKFGDLTITLQNGRFVCIPEQEHILPTKIEGIDIVVRVRKAIVIESDK